jgi:phage-related protein
MRGFLHGSTRADLNDKVQEFRKALAPRQQRLVIDTLDSRGYYFTATCTSLGISEIGGETITHVLWDAEFTAADPFRYENAETAESDIALNTGESVTITNSGDLRIDPIISISTTSASGIALSLTNATTGERIKPVGTITAGDKLVIDSTKRSVRKNGVEIDYAGSFPSLAVGQNTLKVNLSAGSISISIRRRHKFF